MALNLPVITTTEASKRDEAMNKLFDILDTDKSNTLDVEEFKKLGLVMLRSMGKKIRLQDMNSEDARREMLRASSDVKKETLSREDWIKFAQRGLSNLDDDVFFKKMSIYMADAKTIIEEERLREERRARKKAKRKAAKMKKKRSGRRSGSSEFEREPELIKSQTPRLETSDPKSDLRTPVTSSPMQEASVSPISATVSSAREEQAAAIAESASPVKYPRRRSEAVMEAVSAPNEGASAPAPVAESPMKPIVVAKAVSPMAKSVAKPVEPATKVIQSAAQKRSGDNVLVDRSASKGIRINEGKVRHHEFHEATVLVTSLAHLHRSKTKREPKKEEVAPPKTQTELGKVRGRKRINMLKNASKAW